MQISILKKENLETIHKTTLKILSNTGITFLDCPEAIKILQKAGCKVEDKRVYFPEDLVEETIKLVPYRNKLALYSPDKTSSVSLKEGDVHFSTIGNPYYIHDFEKASSRDAEEKDIDDYWLIFNKLKNFEIQVGELIVASRRKKGEKSFLYCDTADESLGFMHRKLYRHKDVSKVGIPGIGRTKEQVRIGILRQLLFRNSLNDLHNMPMDIVWVNPISPLQYDDQASGLIEGAKVGLPISLNPEIMMGGTGPVTLAGSLVQQNAEILAGVVLSQLVKAGTFNIYGTVGAPMDLRVGDISMGNIEHAMLSVATVQMADFYGLPCRVSPGNSGAKEPGVRAAVESALGVYLVAAAGGNFITTGLLDQTLMVSYEHLVVMDEIMSHIRRLLKGIQIDEDRLAEQLIHQEGHPSPNFLRADHTLKYMREEIYMSDFIGRIESSYEDWYVKANRKVKEILDNNPRIDWDEEIRTKIETLEARIREDNHTWKEDKEGWWESYVKGF